MGYPVVPAEENTILVRNTGSGIYMLSSLNKMEITAGNEFKLSVQNVSIFEFCCIIKGR